MNRREIEALVSRIAYSDWDIVVRSLGFGGDRFVLQVHFDAPCVNTGEVERQSGRKWLLSPHMTECEVLFTALKAILTAVEHEAREGFTLDGVRIFGPHLSLDALLANAGRTEVRA